MSDRALTPGQARRKAQLLAKGPDFQRQLARNEERKATIYARRRLVFLQLEASGAKLAEIAAAFGVNESAVSQQLRRAREEAAADVAAAAAS